MGLSCNIDRRGRLARLIYGILVGALGVALLVLWAFESGSLFRWAVSVAVILAGAFAVFEAGAGWCVMRAMGFRTPL